ncbi:MAG TPA: phosphate/phosphite/phosphonate ABC transporter substrate-binding protein [Vicinamibacteria bacterium]|nr:phosphate/phosphite/phosphonate ABC transporter substrate-binding protein [Vicinamibacteria bacterium]
MPDTLLLGAVAYDPKVVTIWEGMREHFRSQDVPFDFALFSNYERQVQSLLAGHIDVAWNTPLAHVRAQKAAQGRTVSLGMRDTDRDFTAKIVVRRDAGVRALADLKGRVLAVGSRDSTQARILPLHFLEENGVGARDVQLLPFDTDLGKHGDTGTSELDVLRALHQGRAAAGAVGDLVWVTEQAAGRVDASLVEVLWTTPPFDHCMFDGRVGLPEAAGQAFQRALFAMRWDDPRHRPVLEMEGLREWVPPREEGYQGLRAALTRQGLW